MTKINIFGDEYELVVDDSISDNSMDGCHEPYTHLIKIISEDKVEPKDMPSYAKERYLREVMRHELFHAVFRACGMEKYEHDEDLVQLLASKFPKIAKLFLECGCAGE